MDPVPRPESHPKGSTPKVDRSTLGYRSPYAGHIIGRYPMTSVLALVSILRCRIGGCSCVYTRVQPHRPFQRCRPHRRRKHQAARLRRLRQTRGRRRWRTRGRRRWRTAMCTRDGVRKTDGTGIAKSTWPGVPVIKRRSGWRNIFGFAYD
ncbi:hypothetical protein L227DRAFT_217923 [Lentinus tigrinus ALCF2SS1-6]|uniref:Uncharacterized protein n=1 Tax=Lentinus tigrinus ALCF2SS1-6 TaxID=1328759 RepID=A0A5C2SQM2_9APHY|nr:hypothetical protein L227DRAFT_217923 [Lentinus tigrinus ALCF2SS1-6]